MSFYSQRFRRHTDRLVRALSGSIGATSEKCLSEGLISDEKYSELLHSTESNLSKARVLLAAVRCKIDINDKWFESFLDILKEVLPESSKEVIDDLKSSTSDVSECLTDSGIAEHTRDDDSEDIPAVSPQVATVHVHRGKILVLDHGEWDVETSFFILGQSQGEEIKRLSERLQAMHLQIWQKEAEDNEVFHSLKDKWIESERKLKEVRENYILYKQESQCIIKEKDAQIYHLKLQYEKREGEVENLFAVIAEKEGIIHEITEKYEAQFQDLCAQHEKAQLETNRKILKYKVKIEVLEKDLKDVRMKREQAVIYCTQAREQLAIVKLEKEQELSKMKDKTHALELQLRDLKEELWRNEVLLHKKDKKIAEKKQEESERQLLDHRRESREIQQSLQEQLKYKSAVVKRLQKELQSMQDFQQLTGKLSKSNTQNYKT